MATTSSPQSIVTLPELANRLKVSPWSVIGILHKRPDIASMVIRSGGRRMFDATAAHAVDEALRERGTHRYDTLTTTGERA